MGVGGGQGHANACLSFFFLSVSVFCIFLFFFLSIRRKCHIVLNVCFNLFVVCQNDDLEHVAGVVTRKWERKQQQKRTTNHGQYLWDEGSFFSGGFQGLKKRRMQKGVFLSLGVESGISTPPCTTWSPLRCHYPPFLDGPVLNLAQGHNNLDFKFPQPQTQDQRVKRMATSDLWSATLGESPPARDLNCLSEVVKAEKKN